MNKVLLIGRVGKDPKITTFRDGGKIAQFTLATDERGFTTKSGKEVEAVTDWHNIVVRQTGLAGVCEKYVRKGKSVYIEGKIRTREYEADGQKKYITEVLVENMELLGGGAKEEKKDDGYTPIGSGDDLPF